MAHNLKFEIEYVKSLAEAGDKNSLAVGHFILFGGLCYFATPFILTVLIGLEKLGIIDAGSANFISPVIDAILLLMLVAAPPIAYYVYLKINRKKLRLAESHSVANRAANSVWAAIVIAMIIYNIAQFAIILLAKFSDWKNLHEIIGAMDSLRRPLSLLLVGVAWWVSASVSKFSKLRIAGYACFIMVPIAIIMRAAFPAIAPSNDTLVTTSFNALTILFLVIIPALYMIKQDT